MEVEKSVAGYFRVAKAQDEMSAPDIYRGQIEDYCKYKRLKLGQVYSDIDFSGTSRVQTPRRGLYGVGVIRSMRSGEREQWREDDHDRGGPEGEHR